jgi:hypothetical protein
MEQPRQAMADWSLWLVLLTLGLLVSSCAMAQQAPDLARKPQLNLNR